MRTLALICIQREQTRCKMDERSSDKMAAKWMRQKRGPVGSLGVMGVGSSPSEHHILQTFGQQQVVCVPASVKLPAPPCSAPAHSVWLKPILVLRVLRQMTENVTKSIESYATSQLLSLISNLDYRCPNRNLFTCSHQTKFPNCAFFSLFVARVITSQL